MNPARIHLFAGALLCAMAAGCGSSQPAAPVSSAQATKEPAERCRGTLGLEAGTPTRRLREKLGLPEGIRGAVVVEVLAGGPAASAEIRVGDLVQEIGDDGIANECELIDQAYGRACRPVRVAVRRAGQTVEAQVTPVDEAAFYEKRCAEGAATGCFRQAWLLWARDRGTDRERALELYDRACRDGSGEACAYGGLHRTETPEHAKDGLAALERACELGSGAGCAHLAFFYATGTLVPRDDRRATPLYVKGCELGDARSCYNVGLMADEGRGMTRDVARAVAAYDDACETGSSTACTNLGYFYEHGIGVAPDAARAVALYQRGCEGTSCQPSNLGGCVNVGRAYRDGLGVEKDAAQAAEIFREACEREPEADDVHAGENGARACSLLGALYLAGDGVEKDLGQGRELSELGCEHGDSFGCFNAAVLYAGGTGVRRDAAKAAAFLQRACDGGDGEGCDDLAAAYEKGNGVARDRRRAQELRRRACELGFEAACAKEGR